MLLPWIFSTFYQNKGTFECKITELRIPKIKKDKKKIHFFLTIFTKIHFSPQS